MRILAAVVLTTCALVGCSDGGDDAASPPTEAQSRLEAAFTYEVERGEVAPTHCPVAAIRFTDRSQGGPTAWSWEFDDGTTSNEQHPVVDHEVYEATLTVTRGEATDTVTEDVSFAIC